MPDPIALAGGPGGWAVAVGTWLAIGVGLVRKWWVPGWMFEAEVMWRERMTAAMERLTDALSPRKGIGGP